MDFIENLKIPSNRREKWRTHMLQIRLLGVLQISVDGNVLPPLPTQKANGLLGYITLNTGKELSREHLAGLFWPDRPQSNARRSLHTALWQIRSLFKNAGIEPENLFTASSNTVCWSPEIDYWLDVPEFEKSVNRASPSQLQNAVDLYRGSFLSNIYEDWCLDERYRLESYYLRALSKLISHYLESRRFSAAMETSRLLLKADLLNEVAHRALMLSNYQLGNRSAAIEQYHECARLLKRELNIDPTEETKNLFQSIQEERIAYNPPVTGSLSPSVLIKNLNNPPINPKINLEETGVFGRDDEYNHLNRWWEDGTQFIIHMKGEPGVGKTRLAQEFVRRLQPAGVGVGWGRCLPIEQGVPFYSIQMALYDLVTNLPPQVKATVPEWQAVEISRVFPELSSLFGISVTNGTDLLDQNRMFSAICNLVHTISQSIPILFVIDDLNWASQSTIHLIEFLVRYILSVQTENSKKVRFLALTNEITVPNYHSMAIIRLRRDQLIFDLDLNPLNPEDVSRWIKTSSGEAKNATELAGALYNKTLGNPLFIRETLGALVNDGILAIDKTIWEGPALKTGPLRLPLAESIKQIIEGRLLPLSQSAIETAQAGAVIGTYFDVNEIKIITGREEESVIKDLEELVTAQIIMVNSPPKKHDFEFRHHLIQQAIYEMILAPSRTLMHRKLARKLIDELGQRGASRILYHYRRSKDLEAVIHWSVIAGRQALKLSDYESAISILRAAEEIAQEIEVPLVTLVEIIQLIGDAYSGCHEREMILHYAKKYAEVAQQMNISGWQETTGRWMRAARMGTSEITGSL